MRTKAECIEICRKAGFPVTKKWDLQTLEFTANVAVNKLNSVLTHTIIDQYCTPGKRDTANDWFPRITVDQQTKSIKIEVFNSYGYQKNCSISTEIDTPEYSADKLACFVRGEVEAKNWHDWRNSKTQSFCFAIFQGDSGHIYIHRAPATKGWMNESPDNILKRLRKLGIGASEKVFQQGDFLLKPANGNAYSDSEFAHEKMGSGHHNFELPQLYHRGQFWIKEATTLIHTAIDGIQHPDILVPPGKYIVGTTASQLRHGNARD